MMGWYLTIKTFTYIIADVIGQRSHLLNIDFFFFHYLSISMLEKVTKPHEKLGPIICKIVLFGCLGWDQRSERRQRSTFPKFCKNVLQTPT